MPVIIIWVIGFPLFVFRMLYKKRKDLDDKDMIIKYGLFYIGLSDHGYYWEVLVINVRKVLFIAVAISLN